MEQKQVSVQAIQMGGWPIIVMDHPSPDDIDAELRAILDSHPKADWGYVFNQPTHQVSDNTFSTNIVNRDNAPLWFEFLDGSLNFFLQTIQYNGPAEAYDMESSWFTKTKRLERATMHEHGHAHIAGVYYLNDAEGKGDLYFHNQNYQGAANPVCRLSMVGANQTVEPKAGRIVLFLGATLHRTQPNLLDGDRHSLSFNLNMVMEHPSD